MKIKLLNYALAACLIVPSTISLAGCFNQNLNKQTFTAAQGVVAATETIIEDLTNNYYNSSALGSSKKYSVADLKENNTNFTYYVDIGRFENIETIETISLGGETFDNDQTFTLSIGNSNFIEDKCFYSEEDKIFIAAPIVAFETVNNSKLKINDSEFDFSLDKTANKTSFTNAQFSAGSTNSVEKNQDNTYNLQFNDAKTYLKLYFDNAASGDVLLTKRVVNGSADETFNGKANYGLTKVENETNNPLGLYPIGYNSSALTNAFVTKYDNTTMIYEAYIIDKGILTATFNIDIVLPTKE